MFLKRLSSVKPNANRIRGQVLIVFLMVGLGLWFVGWALASPAAPTAICTVNGSGPADYSTIQAAVDDASCSAISIAAGTYTGTITITRDVNIWGAGIYSTTVQGNFERRVFAIDDANAQVSLARMWIGYGDAGDDDGGGIYNKGHLTLYDVSVMHNDAYQGGGIYNRGALTLTDSVVESNYAELGGGGIFNDLPGDDYYQGLWVTTTIANSRISYNDTLDGYGGGIYSMGTLTITNSEIGHNACAALYGGSGGGMRVHWLSGPVLIEDSIIHNNYADFAGGILADAPLTIQNSQILTNSAQDYGGGIRVFESLTLTHSTVRGNSAGLGGGLLVSNQFENTRVIVVDTEFTDNTPSGVDIGGLGTYITPIDTEIYASTISDNNGEGVKSVVSAGTLLIRNSQINNNAGDGIYDRGDLTLLQSTVSNNAEQGIEGHDATVRYSTIRDNDNNGIRAYGHFKLIYSTVSGNTSDTCGGGVVGHKDANEASGAFVEVRSSAITGNSAGTDGGGICIRQESELLLNNSTVSDNTADENGGGVALIGPSATASLDHATIAYNTADQDGSGDPGDGGGIYVSASQAFSVARSIVATNNDNSSTGSDHPDCSGDFVDTGLNLIGVFDNSGCTGLGGALQLTGSPAAPLDPLLSPLADNGGPTLTHAPDAASPAVDYQFSTNCPLDVDQRGVDRPQGAGSACDLGSYEIGTCAAPVPVTLSIARSDNDIQLSWTDDPANREYVYYRNTDPFNAFTNLISMTLPGNSYVDYGATGDLQMNYFYRVAGDNACGDRSTLSNKVGEFDFGITPGGRRIKLTMIALPLEGANIPTTADEVAEYIDPLGSIKAVAKWQPQTRSFLVRRVGAPFGTPDFAVAPGDTLVIGANSAAPGSFAWVGDVPIRGSITNTLHADAANFIMVPLDESGEFTPTAAGLAADIGGVLAVARWNRLTQRWVIWTASAGTNFDVYPGYPYAVVTDGSAPPSWP